MHAVTRRQLKGLAGATIDAGGNLVAYSGALQDLFVNPAGGDFRIKDPSVPAGIGSFAGGSPPVVSTPIQTSPPVQQGSGSGMSIGMMAAIALGVLILFSD